MTTAIATHTGASQESPGNLLNATIVHELPPALINESTHGPATADTIIEIANNEETHKQDSILLMQSCGKYSCCCQNRKESQCCSSNWWRLSLIGTQYMHCRRLVQSYFYRSIYPQLVLRSFMTFYCTSVLTYGLILEQNGGYWWFYFTHLSYIGITVYFYTISYLTWEWHFSSSHTRAQITSQPARKRDIFASTMYTTSFTFHVIVVLIYWGLLGRNYNYALDLPQGRWMQFSQHWLEFAFMLIESCLNRVVFVWGHLLLVFMAMLSFILWAWIGAAIFPTSGPTGNGFPYFFTNYNQPSSAAFIAVLAVGVALIYTMSWMWHKLRRSLAKCCRQAAPTFLHDEDFEMR